MIIVQTMENLLFDIEAKTICYNTLASQMNMQPMTFNTIAEARLNNHHNHID